MCTITITPEAGQVLKTLLQKENNPAACVRLRTYKCGCGCHAKQVPGLSIDTMDDLEDTSLGTVDGIAFIAAEDFVNQFGETYAISVKDGVPVLTIPGRG